MLKTSKKFIMQTLIINKIIKNRTTIRQILEFSNNELFRIYSQITINTIANK